jgi:hypothetical protein
VKKGVGGGEKSKSNLKAAMRSRVGYYENVCIIG